MTGLVALSVGLAAFQVGRYDAAAGAAVPGVAPVWSALPGSWWWLLTMTGYGALVGLTIAVALGRQLRALARRTEFLARRNFNFPVELETDDEVTPLVSAINELLESVRDYARHSVSAGLISFARDGRILTINPRAAVALGVDADEVTGRSFRSLIPPVADNAEITAALLSAFDCGQAFDLRDVPWINTRGQRVQVDLQGTVLAGDEPIISVLVVFDRAADLERVQRQVNRAHRLMVVGGFASELAHEIRNPLSSILGLVELLRERLPEGDVGHAHLDVLGPDARPSTSRCACPTSGRIEGLVGQLLDLVPTEIHDVEEIDLNGVVREAVELATMGAPDPGVDLRETYATDLPRCTVDAERIGRVVDNLLRNAFAHTPAGGRVAVETARRGGRVEVAIHNTGSYVPPEDHEKIFRPFVSGRGNGTGLGLAIAQQVAYAHGGSIEIDSDPEAGTTFVLALPARDEPERALAGAA